MDKKILVVDDEKPIADILQFNLIKEGYRVICAYDGDEALQKVEEELPDLMLLDIMLPKRDGMEVCREIRKKYDFPIIMLTAKGSEIDKVLGLEMAQLIKEAKVNVKDADLKNAFSNYTSEEKKSDEKSDK